MREPSKHIQRQAIHSEPNADERARLHEDTSALVTAGIKAAAERALALLQPPPHDEAATLRDSLLQDLARAKAALAAATTEERRAELRLLCDALRLHRVCGRDTCRKAAACRGSPDVCYARAKVPTPVHEWVAAQVVARRVPWAAAFEARHAEQRAAYEAWVAGIEARG